MGGGKRDSKKKKKKKEGFLPPPQAHIFIFFCSIAGASHNSQDVEENVDDVCVEVEGGEDVLLGAQRQLLVAQEKLGVHSQELRQEKTR